MPIRMRSRRTQGKYPASTVCGLVRACEHCLVTLFDNDPENMPLGLFRRDRTPAERRRARGVAILVGSLILTLSLAAVPSSYVIEEPGPVFDTLGTVSVAKTNSDGTPVASSNGKTADKEQVPLITITGAAVFPTTGQLDLLTVSVKGNRKSTPNWLEVGAAWFDPAKAVVPLDAIFPKDESTEERSAYNAALMVNSQHDAIAAALTNLGYNVFAGVRVETVIDSSPAKGILQPKDVILAVNGTTVTDVQSLRDALAANGVDKPASLLISHGGVQSTVQVTPMLTNDKPALGVGAIANYTFPFDVQIRIDDVGGPSAGMMFALGIVDKLTPENITGGNHIAGTGTIDASGKVGPIGGIRQKMFGAQRAGASFFLAPTDNCKDVVGHVPAGLTVFKVSTLNDAENALAFIRMHGDKAAQMNSQMHTIATCEN